MNQLAGCKQLNLMKRNVTTCFCLDLPMPPVTDLLLIWIVSDPYDTWSVILPR